MAKTLLQVVKNVLAVMDSDPVDTIYLTDGGTEESEQVAMFAESLYEYMHSIYDWPHAKILTQIDALGDSEKPNYLKLPANVQELEWLKYRDEPVAWLSPLDFFEHCNERNATDANVIEVTTFEGNTLKIRNDKQPEYYTSFDNDHLVFDSYDADLDTTLQNTHTDAYAVKSLAFTIADDYEVDIPSNLYPLFESELKRECNLRLRQQDSPIDAKRALAGWAKQRTKADRVNKTKKQGFGRR